MVVNRQSSNAAFIRQTIAGVEYIHIFGEVDTETDDEFRTAIADAAIAGSRVVIDLTRCTYIGSQGFAALVDARSVTDLAVIAPERIRRLMEAIGLTDFFTSPPRGYDGAAAGRIER